jgi:cytoskeletal protein CcmA (bactofilin family)
MNIDKTGDSPSLVGRNVQVDGEIRGEENLKIEGSVKGSVKLTGNIVVGKTGVVDAQIEANSVIIQGKVTGNVLARKQLEIQPSGSLIGDCTAQSIDIKEGAVFEGRSQMLRTSTGPGGAGASPSQPGPSTLK